MEKWVTRISRALMMGLAWAGVWVPAGAAVAGLMLDELDPEHIGGPLYSGFICGSIFSAVAGIAADRCRLSELSWSRAAVSGAVSGLLVSVLWWFLVLLSVVGDTNPEPLPWHLLGAVLPSMTVMCAITAVGSVWVARQLWRRPSRAEARDLQTP
jgi:Na+/proline symporter